MGRQADRNRGLRKVERATVAMVGAAVVGSGGLSAWLAQPRTHVVTTARSARPSGATTPAAPGAVPADDGSANGSGGAAPAYVAPTNPPVMVTQPPYIPPAPAVTMPQVVTGSS